MRVIGPLTWVIACVVCSLSQSTVPVVCRMVVHVAVVTGTTCRCGSCCAGTVKYVPDGDAGAGVDPDGGGAVVPGAGLPLQPASASASANVETGTLMESPAFPPRR